jgi:hypothetical protein
VLDTDIIEEDDFLKIKKTEKMKQDVLDEAFKRAELSKKRKKFLPKEKKDLKKIFPIFGIIFIGIISLLIINYLPWMYIKYYNSDINEIDGFFYRDFKTNLKSKEVLDLISLKSNNRDGYNQNYIGLSKEDFFNTPRYCFYGFVGLILIWLSSIIYAFIDKFRNFSDKIAFLFYSTTAALEIIIGITILSLCGKFIGAYFLLYYNKPLIENIGLNDTKLLILAPIILIIFAIIIIKAAMIAADLNFKELKKNKDKLDTTIMSAYSYKIGSYTK